MKKRWIIAGGIALTLGAAATVAVAERGERMREHGPIMSRILDRLDLTDEQKEQLQELRGKHQKARREHREALAAMGKEQREAVMGLLTEEQQETLGEMRGRFLERRGGKGWGREGMRRGGKSWRWNDAQRGGKGPFSRLDLTDEQKERLGELRTEHRAEMRETRQGHRKALESVLTDEQRDKLETMKDEAFYGGGRRGGGKR